MGYDGTERTVRRFVAKLHRARAPEPVVRFETAPGEQAQMDWSEHRLGRTKVYAYAFVGVLGHGSGGMAPSRRSKTLPVCQPFPVVGRAGGFTPWS